MGVIRRLMEEINIVPAFVPGADQNADLTGDWVSLKNYNRCLVLFHKAAGTAGDDPSIRLQQATDVSGTGAKALNFTHIYHKIGATALSAIGTFTRVDLTTATDDLDLVSVNSVDLLTDVGETMIGVEIQADQLDVTNGFDCINLLIEGDDVANANLCTGLYILYDPRHPGATPLEAIAD
jgi:hypothetical protein